MFKNLKLLVTIVGVVAVLVMGLAVPGATQQLPSPWTPPFNPFNPKVLPDQQTSLSRNQIVDILRAQFTTLVASTDTSILLPDEAGLVSLPLATVAAIPREHKDFLKDLAKFMAHEADEVTFGGFYVSDPIKARGPTDTAYKLVAPGAYIVKLVRERETGRIMANLIDSEGDIAFSIPATLTLAAKETFQGAPSKPWIQLSNEERDMWGNDPTLLKVKFFSPPFNTDVSRGLRLDTLGDPNPAFWVGVVLIVIGLVIVVCSQTC